ncbi:TonB-dependent receptor domain-containing protein [Kineobactrum salinum]|uniref:TonB-dependent receptor n=1 Tax=Kineobactrum salinum TaxID=2708301 RepID=A0A6C0U6Q1_9GAMM|nr:TonB-dependent receptor [Kineobactrum salinum]QIB66115.1 TonB-dependent receptor [Kineobactrum salinum]
MNDDTKLYFTWAEGFRRGGANAIYVNLGADPNLLTYEPDTATNWEVGFKGAIKNFATYSIAGFYIDWEGFQFSGTEPVNKNLFVGNGEEARSVGVESELMGYLGSHARISLGYTYTDAEVTEDFLISPGDPATRVSSGDPLPGTPKHMITAMIDYTLSVDNASELIFRLNGSYRSKTVNAFNPVDFNYARIAGFGMLNGAVTYRRDSWDVSLFIDNLSNEEGATTGLFTPYFPQEMATRQIARPRTVGLRFTFGGH